MFSVNVSCFEITSVQATKGTVTMENRDPFACKSRSERDEYGVGGERIASERTYALGTGYGMLRRDA